MPAPKEIFRKEINSTFAYSFNLPENDLYTITIRASCKPGWRNNGWLRFKWFLEDIVDLHFDDEDLRIEIDDLKFGKPNGKRGLFNSPAAFSGTKTLGKIKTVVFNEWVKGREETLDYGGEANAKTDEQSIKWGTRWLYHKAQGIKRGGGRYWRSWKEAVGGYNGGGNPKYVDEVYKIYKDGATIQGFKLWAVVLSFLLLLGSLSLIYYNQGKFRIYQESIPGTHDHRYYISVLDGLKVNRFAFSRYYDNGQEFNFKDSKGISVREMEPRMTGEKLLFLSGYLAGYKIANVVSYSDGQFTVVKRYDRSGGVERNFVGHHITVRNLDEDPEEEIIEESYINYSNAPDELWEKYYDFDGSSGLYEFKELIKTPRPS